MKIKIILTVLGILFLISIGCFYYVKALGSTGVLHTPNDSPYVITNKPLIIKNLAIPIGAKITYKKRYFWEKNEQKKLPNEKNITEISFKEGQTLDWGGVPITSIKMFYNSEMRGYSVSADFNSLDKNNETPFSKLWQSCDANLDITVENINDWSFNKRNILDIASCGVNCQRHFKLDLNQQVFLDNLYNELLKTRD